MSRVVNFFKVIRNNWKKTALGVAAISYGISYGVESYNTRQLMRNYCEDAVRYGNLPLPVAARVRHVTVILNPAANKRKAKSLLEKYCEPLLHLAGIAVTIVQTDSEGHARSLVEHLNKPTDAIIVAGGDGTLSDVITGVMRRYNGEVISVKQCPIAILPLGQTNRVANSLFNGYSDLPHIRAMAEATMAVVRNVTKLVDTMEIIPLQQDEENPIKPVYAVGAIEWGAWRDALARCNKYWYWGSLRSYATYVFSGYRRTLTWKCSGQLKYSDPCSGCSRCYKNQQNQQISTDRRWWHSFVPRIVDRSAPTIDHSKIINENCGLFREISLSTTELQLATTNLENTTSDVASTISERAPSIKIHLGPPTIDYFDFVAEGWRRVRGKPLTREQTLEAKDIELWPRETHSNGNEMFSIDNEEFEVKPIRVKLLPKSVTMFCAQSVNNNVIG